MEYDDKTSLLKWGIIALASAMGVGSYYIFKLPEDNIIEESSEIIIKNESGFDIDLSPNSQENRK